MIIPELQNGRQVTLLSTAPDDTFLYVTGNSDDATNGVGEGPMFNLTKVNQGSASLEFYFNDIMFVKGSIVKTYNTRLSDYMNYKLYAPASTITENGSSTGNANLIESVYIVPAAGDGDYDIDLSENSTAPVLVPAAEGQGYWNWDMPNLGLGTVSPAVNSVGGPSGDYDLFAIPLNLHSFLSKNTVLPQAPNIESTFNYVFPDTELAIVLPCWKHVASVYNSQSDNTIYAIWHLIAYRYKTIEPY